MPPAILLRLELVASVVLRGRGVVRQLRLKGPVLLARLGAIPLVSLAHGDTPLLQDTVGQWAASWPWRRCCWSTWTGRPWSPWSSAAGWKEEREENVFCVQCSQVLQKEVLGAYVGKKCECEMWKGFKMSLDWRWIEDKKNYFIRKKFGTQMYIVHTIWHQKSHVSGFDNNKVFTNRHVSIIVLIVHDTNKTHAQAH